MTRKEFLEFFEENQIVENYSQLCIKFNDFDNMKHPKKEDVLGLLKKWDIQFKYSHPDRLFYEEIKTKEIKFQFNLYTKDGMISTQFMVWNLGIKKTIYNDEIRFICEEINPESIAKLEYPYPFSTSDEDLSEILDFYLNLYVKFKKTFLI
ncbi:hypothetical protein [Maribacter luteus]|uniref:hypothetical protein n=1 Tax=Maribacter luteus TaxID=2594478 RepID=UPI002490239A|nr:hypothetical protein [Maribacter luteus]